MIGSRLDHDFWVGRDTYFLVPKMGLIKIKPSFILCSRAVNRNIRTYEAGGLQCKYSIFWHLTDCSRSIKLFPHTFWDVIFLKSTKKLQQINGRSRTAVFSKLFWRKAGDLWPALLWLFCSVWPIQVLWDWGLKAGPVRSLEIYI